MEYEYWLAAMVGLSNQKKIVLRRRVKSAESIYNIEEKELKKFSFLNEADCHAIKEAQKRIDLDREYERLLQKDIRLITCMQTEYPARLHHIADKPYALYVKGKLPAEEQKSVAVVGARNCTPYGEKFAREYARSLAECGIQIISGLARGIDGSGQRGALLGGGCTFAVVGNGVDICYPRENRGLYEDILTHGGGIMSELPPGTPPLSWHFPRRNRIISGLSDLVLVMEAKEQSGSLITADLALEQGKDVYALPGPADSALSRGCNRLIAQGAGILLSPWELMEEAAVLGLAGRKNIAENNSERKTMLETKENMVYSSVNLYPKSAGQIMEECALDAGETFAALTSLEIRGMIQQISKNYYIRT